MNDLIIIPAELKHWSIYKEIVLELLTNNPEYFMGSYEERSRESDTYWQKEITDQNKFTFLSFGEKNLIGVISAYCLTSKNGCHNATISKVYVKPNYRGKKISTLLYQKLEPKLRENKITRIELDVVTTNPAKKIYLTWGFENVGIMRQVIKIENKYFDECLMEKILN